MNCRRTVERRRRFNFERSDFQVLGVYLALALIWVILAIRTPYFFTVPNIRNVLVQASTLSIIAAGLSIVLIAGEIDLAFATIQAFVGSIAAVLMVRADFPWPLATVLAICAGIAAGVTSAAWRSSPDYRRSSRRSRCSGSLAGSGLLLTNGQPVSGFPSGYEVFGNGRVGPIPVPVIIMAIVYVVLHVMLTRTRAGLKIFAIGGSRAAAISAGISWKRTMLAVLGLSGFLSAISGIIITSRLGAGSGTYGAESLLPAVAGVMIGGVSLFGGVGSLIGTLGGVLIIVSINNGLVLLNISQFWQQVVVGIVILGAVLIDQWAKGHLTSAAGDAVDRKRIGGL